MTTSTDIKTRPIIFSGAMARSILSGAKIEHRYLFDVTAKVNPMHRYGQPGDLLWIGEPWRLIGRFDQGGDDKWYRIQYQDQTETMQWMRRPEGEAASLWQGEETDWRPASMMPLWASRGLLILMRVEQHRLQEMTADDARNEGGWGIQGYAQEWDMLHSNNPLAMWTNNPPVVALSFTLAAHKTGDRHCPRCNAPHHTLKPYAWWCKE